MGRLSTWFSGLTTGMKVLVVVASLTLFAALSPLVALVATLFFVVCIPVVVCRMLRGRLFRRPGILLVGSLAVVLLANGVSDALYGPSAEQASSTSAPETQTERKEARQALRGPHAPIGTNEGLGPSLSPTARWKALRRQRRAPGGDRGETLTAFGCYATMD